MGCNCVHDNDMNCRCKKTFREYLNWYRETAYQSPVIGYFYRSSYTSIATGYIVRSCWAIHIPNLRFKKK